MQNRGLLILLGLTFFAVGYVIFDFQYEKHTENKKSNEALILKLEKDQINEFEIERFGPAGISEKIVAKKAESGWQLVLPVQDRGDEGAISDFIEASTLEKSQQIIKEGDGIDWKIYGLDQPKGRVTFKTNSGQSVSYDVSTMKNFIADIYLRKAGENKVHLASSTWTARVDKQAYDFRDKRIMRDPYSAITQIVLRFPKESYTLLKEEGKWKSPDQPEWNLDQTKAGEISSMLSTTAVLEFVQDGEMTKEELKKRNLKEPKVQVQASLQGGKKWQALFYQNEKKEYFIQTSDPKRLVRVSLADGDKVATKTLAALRNVREPFDFKKDEAQKLIVYQEGGKKEEFGLDRAENIIRSLRNLEVKDFNVQSPPKKLEDFVEVLDQNQKSIFKMSTVKVGAKVFVKTNLFGQLVALEESQIQKLGIEKLFEKEEIKK